MPRGEGMELIEEWRTQGVLILMRKNSLFGTWCLVSSGTAWDGGIPAARVSRSSRVLAV